MPNWFDERLALLNTWQGYSHALEAQPKEIPADLDANENWLIPEAKLRSAAARAIRSLDPRRYPEAAVNELRRAISRRVGVAPASVVPCSGGDQAIDLLCRVFLRSGDRAVVVSPTFSMYRLRTNIAGGDCVEVPMKRDFALPVEELQRMSGGGGLLFICSPNNPTGNQFTAEDVLAVVRSFQGLVVLDEAYVDFADFNLGRRVEEFSNLAVLRTFSKAYGMAGLRLGYILANDSWASSFLSKVQYPYPVSSVAATTALILMEDAALVREWCTAVKRERSWLSKELAEVEGVLVVESKANFLMVSLPVDSAVVHSELVRLGVATKKLGDVLGMRNCLRITVGTRRMNQLLLRSLEEVLKSAP